ncbi:serine hydrolase [Winogradskyella sp. 3972H.M.0a.05]|uniref:serine hydrolase n=1 Tax=Winogradskyella sp. 3972H.M.0a.05 TaxID=2950277 RepID=UPI0033934432
MKTLFSAILFVLFLVQSVASQSHSALYNKIDKLMQYSYENEMFNGTILVTQNGEKVYTNAFGYADKNSNRKMNVGTSVYLASVSKQFTTMAIMILKERGKLSYDDKLSKYFPEFPDYANKVTIRHLMHHTSGIPDHYRLGAYKPGLNNQDVFDLLIKQQLDFQPGDNFSYSNGGYVLLSMIVAKASGVPFHEFMKANIFDPLGMENTLVYDKSTPEIKDRAVGYNANGDLNDYEIFTTGAGGMYSTVDDLHLWDQALYTEKLVSKVALEEAFTPAKLNNGEPTQYGYGWGIGVVDGKKVVQHSGGLNGYRTFLRRNLDNNSGYILLTNYGNASNNGAIMNALDDILEGKPYEMPKVPISKKLSKLLNKKDIESAMTKINEVLNTSGNNFVVDENGVNSLGYDYLGKGDVKTALAIFQFNVERNPSAFNPYDSLGEAQLVAGDTIQAIKNYKKSYELNKSNTNAINVLNRIGVDTSTMVKDVKVPIDMLESYVGEYELQPSFILTITREENRLFVQATGQQRIEAFASSNDRFYSKVVDAQITFNKDDSGKVTGLTLHQNGNHNAPKIK